MSGLPPALRPDPGAPGRFLLRGAKTGEVAVLGVERAGARPVADHVEALDGADAATVAAALTAGLAGWRVAVPADVGELLIAAGARLRRHGHWCSRDLRADPPDPAWADLPAPAGLRFAPAERPASRLEEAWRAAYPLTHPDFALEAGLGTIFAGTVGPLRADSELVLDPAGRVVAAALLTDFPGAPPGGGPWVAELFRHPERSPAGLGARLLRRALAHVAASGDPALGLVVTEGNPAVALYARHGFRVMRTTQAVDLPDRAYRG